MVAAQASAGDERLWTRMLGTNVRTISAVVRIAATPQDVLAAVGQLFPQFPYRMTQIGLHLLNVTVRPVPQWGTEVRCYGDLRPGLRKNWKVDKGIASVMGLVGAGFGGAAGVVGALGLGVLAVVPAVAVGGVFGATALASYRWLYRYALRKATEELDHLLGQLGGQLRSQAVFGSGPAGF